MNRRGLLIGGASAAGAMLAAGAARPESPSIEGIMPTPRERIDAAIAELKAAIKAEKPDAIFYATGFDPCDGGYFCLMALSEDLGEVPFA
jgi:hypothetical protein